MKRKNFIIPTLILTLIISGCGHAVKVPAAAESVNTEYTDDTFMSSENKIIESSLSIPEASVQTAQTGLVGTDFKEISYEPYDTTELEKKLTKAELLYSFSGNADELLALFDQILEEEQYLLLSCDLLSLYNDMDITNKYYQEEYVSVMESFYKIDDRIYNLGINILESDYGDDARAIWDSDRIAYFENYYEAGENINDLLIQEEQLINEYYLASSEVYTTKINGTDYTLDELYYDMSITDEEYAAAYDDILQQENIVLGEIFLELIDIRQEIAASYGFDSYIDFCYESFNDNDFSPEQASSFCENVKNSLLDTYVSLYNDFDWESADQLDYDISGMLIKDQLDLLRPYFSKIHPDLQNYFTYMEENNLYSLIYSTKKVDTGYTAFLHVYNEPFIFNQPVFLFYDLSTIVHEFGHFYAYCLNPENTDYVSNTNLSEIHSQGLELLFAGFFNEIFETKYGSLPGKYLLLNTLDSIVSGCMYDEFQQEVYRLDDPTLDEINAIYGRLSAEYGLSEDPDIPGYDWVLTNHNYDQPFYYISYAVSAIPALEIWEISQEDFDQACSIYNNLVTAGERGTLENTLQACGLQSPFAERRIEELSATLLKYFNSNFAH